VKNVIDILNQELVKLEVEAKISKIQRNSIKKAIDLLNVEGLFKADQEVRMNPEIPKGWKLAEGKKHIIIKYDKACNFRIITPDWHNPDNLADAGEGYRFLTTAEVESDATHWWNEYEWELNNDLEHYLPSFFTYRTDKPLF
jgi:hypothetical protein